MPLTDDTLLNISVVGIPRYSARGISQTLNPIAAATSVRRTVNGNLRSQAVERFQKYQSTITASDMNAPPSFDGIWPGLEVEVDCVAELGYPSGGAADRPVVSGSSRSEQGYTWYRPKLTMLITALTYSLDEWGAANGWTMTLEEK